MKVGFDLNAGPVNIWTGLGAEIWAHLIFVLVLKVGTEFWAHLIWTGLGPRHLIRLILGLGLDLSLGSFDF